MEFLFILSAVLGTLFTLLLGGALLTYIRRTLQVIRAERDGSIHHRILDELDQLRIVESMNVERLDRIEALLEGQVPSLPPGTSPSSDGESGDE